MDKEIELRIKSLDDHRAELLYNICERNEIYLPDIILGWVNEVRSITQTLKILRGDNKPNPRSQP